MGEKIKIKDVEGDSDALASLFAASDCSLGEYLNASKKRKIKPYILIGTFVIFLICLCILWSISSDNIVCKKIFTIIDLALGGCTTIFIHLYWRNITTTIIGGVVSTCLFLVAVDAITPKDAGQTIKNSIEQIQLK